MKWLNVKTVLHCRTMSLHANFWELIQHLKTNKSCKSNSDMCIYLFWHSAGSGLRDIIRLSGFLSCRWRHKTTRWISELRKRKKKKKKKKKGKDVEKSKSSSWYCRQAGSMHFNALQHCPVGYRLQLLLSRATAAFIYIYFVLVEGWVN